MGCLMRSVYVSLSQECRKICELRLRRINRIVVYVELGTRLLPQIGREPESIVCEGLSAMHVGTDARVLAEIGREHESIVCEGLTFVLGQEAVLIAIRKLGAVAASAEGASDRACRTLQ